MRMKTAVITTVHGRPGHLQRQLVGISRSAMSPDIHVVVAVDDPAVADVVATSRSTVHVVQCENGPGPLRIASARNTGALAALERGAEILVFLDVDCIPGEEMLGRYYERGHRARAPGRAAVRTGDLSAYSARSENGYPLYPWTRLTNPHPARPAPPDREVVAGSDYELFWSLSFALTSSTWRTVGGFCEHYRGYGAEDTDFAQMARAAASDATIPAAVGDRGDRCLTTTSAIR